MLAYMPMLEKMETTERLSRARIEKDVFWFELEIPLAAGTVGANKASPLGAMVASIATTKCKRANASHGSQWISPKFCCITFIGHNWYPERTYENAFTKHTQPNGCDPTRKRCNDYTLQPMLLVLMPLNKH